MKPNPLDLYGDTLRRTLHASASTIVCSPYALEEIRAKITRRRSQARVALALALLAALLLTLGWS